MSEKSNEASPASGIEVFPRGLRVADTNQELLSPHAAGKIIHPDIPQNPAGDFAQDLFPGSMSMRVVDFFEVFHTHDIQAVLRGSGHRHLPCTSRAPPIDP
jgi:hypothetical protein